MPTPFETIKELAPDVTFAGTVSVFAWFLIFVVSAIGIGFGVYVFLRMMKFNKKIIIFEKIGKNFEPSRKDRAMEVRIGDAGDTIFYLRKHKKYLPVPQIQTGRRVYWYVIREDSEWINIGIEDIDVKFKKLNAYFLDKEMRHSRVALHRNLKERYQQASFLSMYGGLMAYTGLIAITAMMSWFLFDKFLDVTGAIEASINAAKEVQEATRDILIALDNVQGGGGLRAA